VSANEGFDLPAAALRADGDELALSIEVLGAQLEQALPRNALVERRKVGGLRSKRREVERIEVTLGDDRFELRSVGGAVQATRQKVVRGITLSRQELPLAGWVSELGAAVAATAAISEQDRLALAELLS
jgi:hypothetical protein